MDSILPPDSATTNSPGYVDAVSEFSSSTSPPRRLSQILNSLEPAAHANSVISHGEINSISGPGAVGGNAAASRGLVETLRSLTLAHSPERRESRGQQ